MSHLPKTFDQGSPSSLVTGVVRWLFIFFLLGLSLNALSALEFVRLNSPAWFQIFGYQILLAGFCAALFAKAWRFLWKIDLHSAGLFLLILLFYMGALLLVEFFLSKEGELVSATRIQPDSILVIMLQLVLAPIFEELFFRDYVFRSIWKSCLSFPKAALLSSLFFMLAHMQIHPGAFLLGLVSCILYRSFKSILPCIAFHFLSNASVYFIPYFFPHLYRELFELNLLQYFYG